MSEPKYDEAAATQRLHILDDEEGHYECESCGNELTEDEIKAMEEQDGTYDPIDGDPVPTLLGPNAQCPKCGAAFDGYKIG